MNILIGIIFENKNIFPLLFLSSFLKIIQQINKNESNKYKSNSRSILTFLNST